MPELPEVETVRGYLLNKILKDKITKVTLSNKKSLRNVPEKELDKIVGQSIVTIDRLAKHLIFVLEEHYLIMHLRMEGKFMVFDKGDYQSMEDTTNRFHDVLIIETNKHIVLFQDTRRFATIDMFDNSLPWEENPILNKLGREPFNMEGKHLHEQLTKKSIAIKSALLDQHIIAGIGNIYADEILYAAKIHPERRSKDVTLEECNLLIDSAKSILRKAVKLGGTTIKNFESAQGIEGGYQKYLQVHQREGLDCPCGTEKVKKIRVGGRGTYFCPECQK